jgi:hypothetical protein
MGRRDLLGLGDPRPEAVLVALQRCQQGQPGQREGGQGRLTGLGGQPDSVGGACRHGGPASAKELGLGHSRKCEEQLRGPPAGPGRFRHADVELVGGGVVADIEGVVGGQRPQVGVVQAPGQPDGIGEQADRHRGFALQVGEEPGDEVGEVAVVRAVGWSEASRHAAELRSGVTVVLQPGRLGGAGQHPAGPLRVDRRDVLGGLDEEPLGDGH